MSATILEFPKANPAAEPAQPAVSPPSPAAGDAAARVAALDPAQSFLVEAPAGSGKTGLLVQRMLTLLCRVDRPEAVLALTFTNKATSEMRERVLKALDLVSCDPATLSDFERETRDLAVALLHHDRNRGWNLQQNSHRLNIRTIDSLCGEVARSLPISSGAVGQMSPVEDAMPLYRRATRSVTLQLGGPDDVLNSALRTVLLHRDADLANCEQLLAEMLSTREQWRRLIPLSREELTNDFLDQEVKPRLDRTLESIICSVLREVEAAFPAPELHTLTHIAVRLASADAPAGGNNPVAKCATLTRAPGSAVVDADHWAMLAHLLLTKDGSWRKFGGLHAKHLQVKIKAEKSNLGQLLETLSGNDALLAQLCSLRNLPPKTMPAEDWAVTKALFHLLHCALIELHSIFRETNTCDFTELSIAAQNALTSPDPAQRHRALASLDLQHLLVDEMQDTSSAQYELLEALTRDWDGANRTIFLVGDPKQSIYLFRQARVERFLTSMQTRSLGSVPLTTIRLTTNFRSAAPLVRQFNELFGPIFAAPSSNAIPYTPAVAARTTEPGQLRWDIQPLPVTPDGKDRKHRIRLQREQAEHILQTIHRIREEAAPGTSPTFSILVRARQHAAPIIHLLREHGIPFRGVELEPLDERPEVLDAFAITRALLHPADRVAWFAVLRAPWCGATLADLHHLAQGDERPSRTHALRKQFRERAATLPDPARERVLRTLGILDGATEAIGRMPLSELVERTVRALGAELFRAEHERTNVRRFLELLAEAEAELRPLDAADLQTRLARLYAEPDTTPGAVDVMTIHKAKGLEWDVVFVPELQRISAANTQRLLDWFELPGTAHAPGGVLLAPIPPRGTRAAELGCYVQTARRRQEQAEVARLLYVVTTRARKELHLYATPDLKQSTGEVTHRAGTLLDSAWPAAGSRIQALAESEVNHPGKLEILQATSDSNPLRDLADLRRVPDGFDPVTLQQPLALPWLHARSASPDRAAASTHANAPESFSEEDEVSGSVDRTAGSSEAEASSVDLEAVHRPEGSVTARALGTAVHLYLDQLAQHISQTHADSASLLATVDTWSRRIRATLRSLGTHGDALERDSAAVLLALRNTVGSRDGLWLLQPHPQSATEQAVYGSAGATARTLRLDRSFLAGPERGSTGTDTLWIVDYKTAVPVDTKLDAFLQAQREHYAPQLRNYAQLATSKTGTPSRIMLALFYPMLPAMDAWEFRASKNPAPPANGPA